MDKMLNDFIFNLYLFSEMLCKMGCLSLMKFENPNKATLFGKVEDDQKLVNATILDEENEIFVEPCPEALIKLSQWVSVKTGTVFDCPCHNRE